jgi:hypothetical protein
MNQIALALEHYWHLRAQGVRPVRAQAHVRQRFGIEVALNEAEDSSDACEEVVQAVSTDFGTEFCKTIWGTSTGPRYG